MRFIASVAIASLCMTAQAQTLPVFPANNVPETFFGTVVDDPYRALENDKDPAVSAWMKAPAEHAHRSLEGLKGYGALKSRIAELDNAAAARVTSVRRVPDGTTFFLRRLATENTFKLYARGAGGKETLVADPDDWQKETGKPHAINYYDPSPDGRVVAVGVSPGGNEMATLYLIDTATKQRIGAPIDRARYASVSWLPDGKSFFYTRGPILTDGMPMSESLKNRRSYYHVVDGVQREYRLYSAPMTATRHIRIVAFTAFAMRGDEAKMRAAGCDGYLSKPIDVKKFGAQVRDYLHA